MISFPNCKINLGLRVVGKRADGYHDIDSVFYPLPLYDILEIIKDRDRLSSTVLLSASGIAIPGEEENNLCIKACTLLRNDFPKIPALKMHLHKAIPMGAGLGGGSADAAVTLTLLNDLFHLQLSPKQLQNYALQLGSDCPFFISNQPSYAQGRGELLEPVSCDLSPYAITLINPGIHISTGRAFAGITPEIPEMPTKQVIAAPVNRWKDLLKNDFEKPVFSQYPEIENIKTTLYTAGALYASMTGTGSTVYALFEQGAKPNLKWPAHYVVKTLLR